ncbi:MAG: hypothetical protein AT718_11060 [Vulcanisaeta sp. JCHS_4]|nr:MAG: hypothetical protein AT718_11060 [Vulcanisaeta sp. JCHS_4]
MHGSSHGVKVLLPVGFDDVVNALRNYKYASNVYFTVLGTSPRVAVFIGGKFFVRTLGFITVITVVIDNGNYTEVKIVTHTNEFAFKGGDLGASKSYAFKVLKAITKDLGVSPSNVLSIDYMDSSKSTLLG